MKSDLKRFTPYLKYLRPVRGAFIWGILCGILFGASTGLGIPLMIKWVFPRVFDPAATPLTNLQLGLVALWLPFVFVIRGIANYLNVYLIQYCGTRVLEAIRIQYFNKLQALPLSFLKRHQTGDLISRGVADTGQLQNIMASVSNDIIKEPATLLFALGAITWQAFHVHGMGMVLASLAFVPITVLPVKHFGKKLAHRVRLVQKELGSVTDRFSENLAAAREVRAFGLESRESERFATRTRALITLQLKAIKYSKGLTPIIEVISSIGIAITFIYAYKTRVPLEAFLSVLTAIFLSYSPIKKLGGVANDLKRGQASLDRLEEVLLADNDITDPANPVDVARLRGDLAFHGVDFSYKPNSAALVDVSVSLPAGTVCALVGPSGAGKSTFANLVPRFYDASSGRVTIDGINVRDMRLADLRRNIAVVSQDPFLFNDTIYHNILLGRPEASRAEVEQAARDAFAHDFILAQPQGYETLVGERGSSLSGGQRQRIALARAFLRNAPLLILDEATSALDSESETAIQQALKKLVVGKTVLIIAHRFSTIRDASMILVFDRGRIVATGSHAELYSANPLYKSLYDSQGTAA